MAVVVDASVAAKWLIPEDGSDAAQALLAREAVLIAPALLLVEVASVLWKSSRSGRIAPGAADAALAVLPGYFAELVADGDLIQGALHLASALDHPVYDCLYIALAQSRDCPLVTADARLVSRLVKSPHRDRVMSLADWRG